MKTLRKLQITGGLFLNGTGVPAAVGDQVEMFLDTDANPDFPESILGVIQHPIVSANCGSVVEYSIEYDEADLEGSVAQLRPQDVIDTVLTTQYDVVAANLDALTAVVATKAPLASPALTGNPTAPTATPGDNDTSIATTAFVTAADAVVTAAYVAADLLKAPLASPALTGNPTAPTASPGDNDTSIATTAFVTAADVVVTAAYVAADLLKAPLASPTFTGVPAAPTAAYATSTTQLATTAFVSALFTNGFANTPQALSGAGAVDVVSLTTALTSTGVAQALTLADGQPGQIKVIAHVVDGGSSVLTPTTKTGFTTVTFTNVGETAVLQWHATVGWLILSLRGAIAA